MKNRIRCPWHNEKTPSLVRRKSDYYCYGGCSKSYTLQEVAEKGIALEYEEDDECKEDLEEKFAYIASLPSREIRGLKFPADYGGYYVCWPDKSYYKYRLFEPGKGGKYLSPRGHFPTPFWARRKLGQTLCIVEGELNSVSLAQAFPEWDVVSPGSATLFGKLLKNMLTDIKKYSSIVVIVDKDAAGLKALIETKALFLYKIPFVNYVQLEQDCNEILVEKGKAALREKVQRSYS